MKFAFHMAKCGNRYVRRCIPRDEDGSGFLTCYSVATANSYKIWSAFIPLIFVIFYLRIVFNCTSPHGLTSQMTHTTARGPDLAPTTLCSAGETWITHSTCIGRTLSTSLVFQTAQSSNRIFCNRWLCLTLLRHAAELHFVFIQKEHRSHSDWKIHLQYL
jgi:hypothetical protein